MPRKSRIQVPGAVYHIMAHCIDTYALFLDDSDKEYFLNLLDHYITLTDTRCYAWVLMNTHYHLVVCLSDKQLWEIMKPLNMRYAHYHGSKYARRGPLFLDRYKSIATQDQNYIQELVRYVHLNPVRAGICKNIRALQTYEWCGHSVLMGKSSRNFQDVWTVLRRFGDTPENARQAYCSYLQEGLKTDPTDTTVIDLVRKSNKGVETGKKTTQWVIGDQQYVSKVLASDHARRLRISRFESEGGTFTRIREKVESLFTVSEVELRTRSRGGTVSDARKVFAFLSAREYGAPVKKIALYLGVGDAAVSAMIQAGRLIVKKNNITI